LSRSNSHGPCMFRIQSSHQQTSTRITYFIIKSFKEPKTLVSDHLKHIVSKQFGAPMVHNQFHLSAYVPNQTMTAADLIDATQCQSLWVSNFKRTLANTTISKVLANWLEKTLHHSPKDTRMNPSYRPALDNGFSMYYQEACTTERYKKKNHFHKGTLWVPSLPYR
jgi:hypothetical protein